jgi:hypothetical protein
MASSSASDFPVASRSDPEQSAKWSWRQFPVGIALASLLLAIALEVLGNDIAAIGRALLGPWLSGACFLGMFLIAAVCLDRERRRATFQAGRTLALVLLLLLALGSFGSLLVVVQVVVDHPVLRFLFATVVAGLSFYWLQGARSRVKRVRRFGSIRRSPDVALQQCGSRPTHAAKYIIYLVSPTSPLPTFEKATGVVTLGMCDDGSPFVVVAGRGERPLHELVRAATMKTRANWQQVLRGLCPHASHVSGVWLIGSSGRADEVHETNFDVLSVDPDDREQLNQLGSRAFLPLLRQILGAYVPIDRVHIHDSARQATLDFEDFEALAETVREVIAEIMRRDPSVRPSEIVIDCTGGQKTASIVGAAITLTDEVRFQYVTNAGVICLHDLRFDEGPTMS